MLGVMPCLGPALARRLDAAELVVAGDHDQLLSSCSPSGSVSSSIWCHRPRAGRPADRGPVAVILLEIGKRSLGAADAFSMSSLYGSLGLIPVFMFWMYLMWMFVLFARDLRDLQASGVVLNDEQQDMGGLTAGSILEIWAPCAGPSGGPFIDCGPADAETAISTGVDRMLERLEAAGYLHQVDRSEAYAFAALRSRSTPQR